MIASTVLPTQSISTKPLSDSATSTANPVTAKPEMTSKPETVSAAKHSELPDTEDEQKTRKKPGKKQQKKKKQKQKQKQPKHELDKGKIAEQAEHKVEI
ncbi:hypothetical protein J5X98_05535 [Leptothermofonsia sichuanensis E412]|uniref:hypothetical protein n=1 Tax=Leptothermofonsia sichuanensis TaxID=2917832 RepID=UPI001CA665BA|nr:hypothetical protein [Leptothermofonsia sichuanensis]QZZ21893.1 hypothetical protein J5X98_05535 [Leptothermofonsia sichuanensis E412]